jgi:flavin reductase (DIM6/NTAB) family NADH-FMN oxidoreductase RutF
MSGGGTGASRGSTGYSFPGMADDAGLPSFNRLVGALHYPMFLVTTTDGRRRAGCLVGFAGQSSIDPPRFTVSLSKRNYTHAVATHGDRLAVHVPTPRNRDLAELFGSVTGYREDKFRRCAWKPGPGGVPLLTDCPQWFVGTITDRFDTGDHEAFLLEPTDVHERAGAGQLDFQDVLDIEPGNEA